MSLPGRDTPRPFQPPVAESDVEAEVIYCVGGVLSPILSNIMLDDLDRELWQRGHRFARYADDLRVFVRSERAAQRVFDGVCGVIERRLRLKVNREKSSIRHAATLHCGAQRKLTVSSRSGPALRGMAAITATGTSSTDSSVSPGRSVLPG